MAWVSFQVLLAAYAGCVATLCIPANDYSSGYWGVLAFIGFAALAVLCIPQSAIPLCATAIASLLASFFSPVAAVVILSSSSGCLLYLHRPRSLPTQWAALFPDLRLVDPWSPLKPEFLSCIKAAFQGSASTSPEGCLDWAFAEPNNEPRDKHCGKLGSDPSDARKVAMRLMGRHAHAHAHREWASKWLQQRLSETEAENRTDTHTHTHTAAHKNDIQANAHTQRGTKGLS